MLCFMMKALTLDNSWFEFNIEDVPTRFSDTEFALLGKPNTPRLLLNSIRRGDPEMHLCEGDIILHDNEKWLICYERGFYAINTEYITKQLYQLDTFEVIGDCFSTEFPIPLLKRNKCLYKFGDVIFRLEDIVGMCSDQTVILRSLKNPIPIAELQQEAGIVVDSTRLYFGDKTDKGVVDLYKGRIAYRNGTTFTDVITGGEL